MEDQEYSHTRASLSGSWVAGQCNIVRDHDLCVRAHHLIFFLFDTKKPKQLYVMPAKNFDSEQIQQILKVIGGGMQEKNYFDLPKDEKDKVVSAPTC